jgi:hypothetical protein
LKIKKILANELQLNNTDTMLAFCLSCRTDYTFEAIEGVPHICFTNNFDDPKANIDINHIKDYINTQVALNLLGNRSTDKHNEAHYRRNYPDYQLWSEVGRQVIQNDNNSGDLSDKAQLIFLRKPTKAGGIQPSPFTEEFISLPKKILRNILSFLNLQVKS